MRTGFTLVELAAVIVVTSVLAISAAPVLSRVADTRRDALSREVERTLELARSRALDAGNPAGVRLDTTAQTITMIELPDTGAVREFMEPYDIAQRMPGTSIASHNLGRVRTLWFAPDGTPHLRQADGTFIADLTADATITIESGDTLTIEPTSGRISR